MSKNVDIWIFDSIKTLQPYCRAASSTINVCTFVHPSAWIVAVENWILCALLCNVQRITIKNAANNY